MFAPFVDPDIARAIDQLPNELNEFGFDPWGFHPEQAKTYFSLAKIFYDYFRPEIRGIENVPAGRVLLVPNHAGQVAFDGLVVAVACLLHANPPRLPRGMAERFIATVPWVSESFARAGVVTGDPINCRNLLESDNAILVFPEGAKGSGKVFRDRYKLRKFGRGFMRLALQTNTPIVPIGVVGSEESILSVHDSKTLARLVRAPYFPISPLLPLLGPLAYLPLPVKFHVEFGKPLVFDGPFDDEDSAIDEKVNVVEAAVQRLVDDGLERRTSWFE